MTEDQRQRWKRQRKRVEREGRRREGEGSKRNSGSALRKENRGSRAGDGVGSVSGDLAPGPGPQGWQNVPTSGFPLPSLASQGHVLLPHLSQLAKNLLN